MKPVYAALLGVFAIIAAPLLLVRLRLVAETYGLPAEERAQKIARNAGIEPSDIEIRRGGWYYRGHQCSDDCSGHIAGYQWAKKNQLDDPAKCGETLESFREGCVIYTKELDDQEAAKQVSDGSPD